MIKLTKNQDSTLELAIACYGAEAQLDMVVEECAELIKAIQKYKRNIRAEAYVDKSVIDDVIEEAADVQIMLLQVEKIFNKSNTKIQAVVNEKIKRLSKRLEP